MRRDQPSDVAPEPEPCQGLDHSDGVGASFTLVPQLYEELRSIAARLLRGELSGHTLQATALVHEAWLRLEKQGDRDETLKDASLRDLAIVAIRSMRQILVDHARHAKATKRGGHYQRIEPHGDLPATCTDIDTLLDLETALARLEARNPRLARIAEFRIFGGLSSAELAAVLELSPTTVKQEWSFARAVLARDLERT